MLDFLFMLWVKLPGKDRIHPQSKKFATFVERKATGFSELNDSPEIRCVDHFKMFFLLWQPIFTNDTPPLTFPPHAKWHISPLTMVLVFGN